MKVPDQKIEKALPKNDVRFYLNEAYLEVPEGDPQADDRKGTLIATDGYILAVVPVELDRGDTQGFVKPEALAAARKQKTSRHHGVTAPLFLTGAHVLFDKTTIPRNLDDWAKYPDWRKAVPENLKDAQAGKFDVCFNAALLARLAEAIGTGGMVKLTFQKREDGTINPAAAITVTPYSGDSYGVLMTARG